ncbi:hypothetical protein FVE85_5796 [Porphyridium purpureum]|uniref:DUF202 domain-containing protein n=1 Tax=Porphyridium purpureum TaxID=35688 RepID=A0A5J4Z2W5_PORPP|nr:hypothetical protein FVE85_5796 [Porphyridium purpureum]|eukprot:POR7332..scf295_1
MIGIFARAHLLKGSSSLEMESVTPAQEDRAQTKKSAKKKKEKKDKVVAVAFSEEDPLLGGDNTTPADATMKNAMASERTYMKWVWTALRLGALGTFILSVFSRQEELLLIIAIWVVALAFMGLGLWQYYSRRHAMLVGLDREAWDDGGRAIYLLVFACTVVFACVFVVLLRNSGPEDHEQDVAGAASMLPSVSP